MGVPAVIVLRCCAERVAIPATWGSKDLADLYLVPACGTEVPAGARKRTVASALPAAVSAAGGCPCSYVSTLLGTRAGY